jgi:eukaryotic-like serine/threonine-protein kinase
LNDALPIETGHVPLPDRFAFGEFQLDVHSRQLFRNGVRVPISAKAADTLYALVRRRGETASKDELISEVWPDTFVSEDSLTQNISSLRRLLEDDAAQPRFIATVARVGYRFVAPVTTVTSNATVDLKATTPALSAANETPVDHPSGSPVRPSRSQWLFGGLLLAVGIGLGLLLAPEQHGDTSLGRQLRFVPELPPGSTLASGGVVSPDGRHIAFIARDRQSGETKLWIRTLSTGSTFAVPGSDGASRPFWSPNSRSIAFFSASRLHRAPLAGGNPAVVCNTAQPRPSGGTWNERDEILFADGRGLSLVSAQGGEPRRTLEPSASSKEIILGWPQFLPGGRRFLYEVLSSDETLTGIYVGSLDHEPPKKLLDVSGSQVAYTRGYLLYVYDGRLLARGFDSDAGRLTAEPLVIADALPQDASISAATDAVIAFGGGPSEELTQFDRHGGVIATVAGVPALRNLTLSSDRRTLVGESVESGRRGVWVIDLARQVATRIVADGTFPLFLDPRTLAYAAAREPGPVGLYLRDMARGAEQLLLKTPARPIVSDASPDGQQLVYVVVAPATRQDIWTVSRAVPEQQVRVIASPAREIQPDLSPDGRWVAYASDEEGAFEVYVDGFPRLGHKKRVSISGGAQPQWSGDGQQLFYLSGDQTLMSVDVRTEGGLELSPPSPLFRPMLVGLMTDFRNQYTVTPDGRAFFVGVASQSGARQAITVIVNWRGSTE